MAGPGCRQRRALRPARPGPACQRDHHRAAALRLPRHAEAALRLAPRRTPQALGQALADLAGNLAPVSLPGLRLARIGGFLALVPEGDAAPLAALAARVVAELDPFRAPLTGSEIARRRPERLSPRQRELLDLWGYPFVMEEFRFHLTLTDRLEPACADRTEAALTAFFAPVLPRPFQLRDLCLFGEGRDGLFRLLHRYTLSG